MKLHTSEGSPYARIVRVVILEKGLQDRVEIVLAATREPDSPYYSVNPSGRVPYLERDDGVGLEESALICDWLDRIDGRPAFAPPPGDAGWEARRLEAMARSLMDGLAVWSRERALPPGEQSPGLIAHEAGRSARLLDAWERQIDDPLMNGPLNMAQVTLGCALGMDVRNGELVWRPGRPRLTGWHARIAARPSFAKTVPPARH